MSTQVDDLQIKLTAEANAAESSINSLIGKLSTLQTILRGTIRSAGRMGGNIANASENIAKKMGVDGLKETKAQFEQAQKPLISFKDKVEEVRKSLGNLGADYANKGGKFDTAERINKEIEKVESKLYNLEQNAGLKKFGSEAYNNLLEKGALLSNQLDSLKQKLASLGGTSGAFGDENVEPTTQEEVNGAAVSFGNLDSAMQKVAANISLASVFKLIKSSIADTVSIVKKAASAFNKFARVVGAPLDSAFKKLGNSITEFSVKNLSLIKNLTRVLKMLKLMITRMALRGVISEVKTSFGELVQFSEKVANAYNKIRNAIKYLADSLAALVAPILNSGVNFRGLGDVIDAIADKIVALVNKINQLISALTGKTTWIQAQKQQKNYAASMDKTSKSAKKLNKQLAAFDELNNLTTSESGGNNNDTGTGGSQFKEQPIDPKYLKMAEWLKDMWKKGDGTALGDWLADKIIEALKKIPWGKIQNFARRLGSFLATTLNGLFRREDLAKEIGNAIASAINTGLIFAEEFIKKFDFEAFGKFIGIAISEAIKGIHWTRLQNACKGLGEGIAKAINSLLSTGVLRQIGYAVANLLLAAINFAFSLITNIDWDLLGQELNAGIKRFLSTMSAVDETGLNGWQKLGKTISDAVKGALKAINTVLGDPETRQMIGDAIRDFFNSFDYKGMREAFWNLAVNLVKLFGTMFKSAMESDNFRAALGDIGKVFALVVGAKIISGFASFASSVLSIALGKALGEALMSGGFATFVSSAIGELSAMFSTIAGGFEAVAAAIGTSVAAILGAIGLVIAAIVVWVKNWDAIKEAAVLFCERTVEHLQNIAAWFKTNLPNFTQLVSKVFDDIKANIQARLEFIKNIFLIAWTLMKTTVTNVAQNIAATVRAKLEEVKNIISNVFTAAKNIIESLSKIIYNIITGNFKAAGQAIIDVFNQVYTFFSDIFSKMSSKLKSFGEDVKTTFNNSLLGKALGFVGGFFRQNAGGGIYSGGKWHPIQSYASGGIVNSAEMFIARENGAPEMVGQIGGHTAVANNDQIVASIESGVFRAVKAAMGSGGGGTQTVQVEVIPDKDNLFSVIQKQGNDYQRRTGNPVWA